MYKHLCVFIHSSCFPLTHNTPLLSFSLFNAIFPLKQISHKYQVAGSKGSRHYQHCVQTSADTLSTPHLVLDKLNAADAADILSSIQRKWGSGAERYATEQEKNARILEVGLLLHLGYLDWALFGVGVLLESRGDLSDFHEEVKFLEATRGEILARKSGGRTHKDTGKGVVAMIEVGEGVEMEAGEFVDQCEEAVAQDDAEFLAEGKVWWERYRDERLPWL